MWRHLINGLRHLEDGILALVLTLMILLAIGQVLLRNFWGTGFDWADPLLRILVLWIALLGAMAATRDDNHISIDVLSKFLPRFLKKPAQLISHWFAAVICSLLAWQGARLTQMDYQDATMAFASVPAWICQLIIPFGFGVMSLRFLLHGLSVLLNREAP